MIEVWRPAEQLGVGFLELSDLAKQGVMGVLQTNRLSYGPVSRRYERLFAELHGCEHAIVSNSGTSALHIALAALKEKYNWSDGDEVVIPAVTFVATANVILQLGLRPIFVDVDPKTYNIDCARICEAVSPRTRCIMPVHLCGLPADMAGVLAVADRYGLRVVEDSCEAMFVNANGKPVGSHGDVGCFSTYSAHLLVTGVGGISTTSDQELATIMRSLCNHGRDPIYIGIDDDKDCRPAELAEIIERRFSFQRIGYSYRITEMEAAIGLAGLADRHDILARRQRNALLLSKELCQLNSAGVLKTPSLPEYADHAFMMYPMVLSNRFSRRDLTLHLEEANIETRPLLPLINQPVYTKLFGNLEPYFPIATNLNKQAFYIGCHQGLGDREIAYIGKTIRLYFTRRHGVDLQRESV